MGGAGGSGGTGQGASNGDDGSAGSAGKLVFIQIQDDKWQTQINQEYQVVIQSQRLI